MWGDQIYGGWGLLYVHPALTAVQYTSLWLCCLTVASFS